MNFCYNNIYIDFLLSKISANGRNKFLKQANNPSMKNRIAVFCDNRGLTRKAIFARASVYLIAIVLFVIYVAFQAGSGEQWFKGLLNSTVAIILASVGQTFVLYVHGIDLSIAGLISFANCATASFIPGDLFSAVIFIMALLIIGFFAGFINGIVITRFKLPPFIVTFASWFIWEGLSYYIAPIKTNLAVFAFSNALTGRIFSIPIALIIIAAICALWLYFRRTHFGISLFAIAHNKKTAYYCGINVDRITVVAYMICAALSVAAGIFAAAETMEGSPSGGDSYLLLTLCAVFLGGADLKHNKGSVLGTIAGCFVLQLFIELILIMGVPIYWAQLIRGLLFIFIILIKAAFSFYKKND